MFKEIESIDLNQIHSPQDTLQFYSNNNLNVTDKIQMDSNDIFEKNTLNDLELNSIFLTMFYNANLTQTSFCDLMKTFKMITNLEIPTSFNSCSKKLLSIFREKIDYEKQ